MVQCAVYGCNSNNNKKLKKNTVCQMLNYFSFPQNADICRKWVEFCGRQDKFTVTNSRICSLHFTLYDYSKRYDILDTNNLTKRKLKPGAVPSLNLSKFKPSCPQAQATTLKPTFEQLLAFDFQSKPPLIDVSEPPHLEFKPTIKIELDASTDSVSKEEDLELIKAQNDEILQLKNAVENYKNEIKILQIIKNKHDVLLKSLKKIFSIGQLKKLQNDNRRIIWSSEDISNAVALHSAGPRAYRWLLRKGHPLPALSTLRKWKQMLSLHVVVPQPEVDGLDEMEFLT